MNGKNILRQTWRQICNGFLIIALLFSLSFFSGIGLYFGIMTAQNFDMEFYGRVFTVFTISPMAMDMEENK